MENKLTDIEKIGTKKRLIQLCIRLIEDRIAANLTAIENAQANANAEEKSSAGDKYETSRAMSHLEKDMYSGQLAANRKELASLCSIDCSGVHSSATRGSFIRCAGLSFFIAAGIGKVHFEGEDIFLLSPGAPLGKLIYDQRPGNTITFNKKELIIVDIF